MELGEVTPYNKVGLNLEATDWGSMLGLLLIEAVGFWTSSFIPLGLNFLHQYNMHSNSALPLPQGCCDITDNTGNKKRKNKTSGSKDGIILYFNILTLGKKQHGMILLSNCSKLTPFLNVLLFLCRCKSRGNFALQDKFPSSLTRLAGTFYEYV